MCQPPRPVPRQRRSTLRSFVRLRHPRSTLRSFVRPRHGATRSPFCLPKPRKPRITKVFPLPRHACLPQEKSLFPSRHVSFPRPSSQLEGLRNPSRKRKPCAAQQKNKYGLASAAMHRGTGRTPIDARWRYDIAPAHLQVQPYLSKCNLGSELCSTLTRIGLVQCIVSVQALCFVCVLCVLSVIFMVLFVFFIFIHIFHLLSARPATCRCTTKTPTQKKPRSFMQ